MNAGDALSESGRASNAAPAESLPESSLVARDLEPTVDALEADLATYLAKNREAVWPVVALLFLLVASPLVVFWLHVPDHEKWAETVKNVVESGAALAAALAIVKWVTERRDRATEVLLKLEERFSEKEVVKARDCIDDQKKYDIAREELSKSIREGQAYRHFDPLLRFYVVLYGVRQARQVPDEALSVCFRYWLALYFHKHRTEFRQYVDEFYPTLSRWLRKDCEDGSAFFRPQRLFGEDTDTIFIRQVRGKAGK